MSKKNKQDKIIAKLRHELELAKQELARTQKGRDFSKKEEAVVAPITENSFLKKNAKSKEKFELKKSGKKQAEIWDYPSDLIKKDLRKTLILSVLAISFELVLYWFKLPN